MQSHLTLHIIGWLLLGLALLGIVPAFTAYAFDHSHSLSAFLSMVLIYSFLGGGIILASRGKNQQLIRSDLLFLHFYIWFILPLAAAVPIYFSDPSIRWSAAHFEAISGLTTTGMTSYESLAFTPKAVLIWRALLQWLGGLLTLIFVVSFMHLISRSSGGKRSTRQEDTIHKSFSLILWQSAETIFPIYTLLSLMIYVGLAASGIPQFDAICLTLSSISTGGFMPRDGTILQYGSNYATFIIAMAMAIGMCSFIFVITNINKRWSFIHPIQESVYCLFLVAIITSLLMITTSFFAGGEAQPFQNSALHSAFLALSLSSTTGYFTYPNLLSYLPPLILISLCLVGGTKISTTGGFKIANVFQLYLQLFRELRGLVYPNIVRPILQNKIAQRNVQFNVIWSSFTNLLIAIVLSMCLMGLAGVPFLGALLAASDATSNFGHLYEQSVFIFGETYKPIQDLPAYAHYGLGFAMIAGRIEIIAIIALITALISRR